MWCGLNRTQAAYKDVRTVKICCGYCTSDKVRFIDFGNIDKRLNDEQITVTEIWACKNCGREFERLGILYSPLAMNQTRLQVALLSGMGYFAGSMLAYTLLLNNIV